MNKNQLVKLCSRSWSLAALGLLSQGVSGRVSPLAAAAGSGRPAMTASVQHLVSLHLLERNPGHGHPLRPEYRLTSQGILVADWAAKLYTFIDSDTEKAIIRNKWSLPIISCLPEERRYSDIRRELKPITDRALSNCLGVLTDYKWITRSVSAESTPVKVNYSTNNVGKNIYRHLLELPAL